MIDTTPRRRHAESFSDAVIAAYIHDLRRGASPRRRLRDNRHSESRRSGGYSCEHAAVRLRAVS
jgi:hypothetical protein